jgi:hypothetical protein
MPIMTILNNLLIKLFKMINFHITIFKNWKRYQILTYIKIKLNYL